MTKKYTATATWNGNTTRTISGASRVTFDKWLSEVMDETMQLTENNAYVQLEFRNVREYDEAL